ncbi:mRNA 3'-end-processing protein rna14 [Yamadazyma tenuis]|uniref:mRNA 3'-end-processing protein RNA14 n=1 Tax=Candida tenuis (strain ATCC 10573 / BCRC 21748 / CBS 615 / JCM 9827 / NBRC 10315 / NRRL Y-1498 / VKM Y-70) TaxID=590646 RepID=G3BDQ1_CANTC|nr:uncharacterized protein CANTEDRAFT_99808 [Yamadazyma tenuis ATCC 10573]EGV60354.1 hypothetical protein CANTEDRAFT_99808 [Yamadazyma tenuis ATCC 10573]WEJ94403.1 mRNA 3'-end-processing protein rna14 [Yamadazyma tenuis]
MSGDSKKKRLALDVIGQLEDDLKANPLDYAKWNKLIKQVVAKDKEEQIRKTFDKYLSIFQYDGKQWCTYITYEMSRQDFLKVQELFSKCITVVDNVELFRLYVSYVRRVNDVITGGEKARGIVIQAFEFAVNRVGIDLRSGDLWTDYLDFLKSWTPSASWEQQQKLDLIRKVYKKMLVIPTEKIEALWSTYTKWENEVNSSTASRFIADKSSEFMEARSWNVEWHNITKNQLRRDLIPSDISSDVVKLQLNLWYKWVEFERRNGLNLKDEKLLEQRIEYVYKQSVMSLVFVPEVWYKYNNYNKLNGSSTSSIDLLTQGLILNPTSYLLSFELSELYEKENNISKANETLESLINSLTADYEVVVKHIDTINERSEAHSRNGKQAKSSSDNMDEDDDDQPNSKIGYQLSDIDIRTLKALKSQQKELSRAITLVYTKQMMTNKRSSGIKESRQIFKQAKKFAGIGNELYVENALTEYYSDNKNIARKVFELGMKTYGTDGDYLLSYLDFLIMVNETENIKVLFEVATNGLTKVIEEDTIITEDVDTPVWIKDELKETIERNKLHVKRLIKRYSKFATKFLDLGIVASLESRYRELFSDDDPIIFLSSRYAYDDVDLIRADLGMSTKIKEPIGDGIPSQTEGPDAKRRKVQLPSRPVTRQETPDKESNSQISQQQSQGFIGNSIYNLLRVLPNSSYFGKPEDRVFNSKKLVELLNSIDLPK